MYKYFFDLVGPHCCEYDYKGAFFSAPEQALPYAELLALDLEIDMDGQWSGWTVQVCDAQGHEFCSVPVRYDLIAA
jgi:hypothetical protein